MTTVTDICNRALQRIGTRTTVTDDELTNNTSNEAIQFNLMFGETRDRLLRMAPWDCGLKTVNLTYITSLPGTPENQSPATAFWTPGQPSPPWAYEYQYPVDCLRSCWITPTQQTGFAGGVPITTAVTGGASSYLGPPVRFAVRTDQFIPVTAAEVVDGGTGYIVGDIITLMGGVTTDPPMGAPAQLEVLEVDASGAVTNVGIVNVINGEEPALGGSYFRIVPNPQAQSSSTGLGTGATFNLTWGAPHRQRVILCNQQLANLVYVHQVQDPNLFDPAFRDALYDITAAILALSISGDKKLANGLIEMTNDSINKARTMDGNEALTVNDVTPDWIRFRGIWYTEGLISGPYVGFDWGNLWPSYF